jgi:hypothetical protein
MIEWNEVMFWSQWMKLDMKILGSEAVDPKMNLMGAMASENPLQSYVGSSSPSLRKGTVSACSDKELKRLSKR